MKKRKLNVIDQNEVRKMDEFRETEVVIPVDDHLGATTIVATINHPKEGVRAFAQCRGPRWCVVIRTPIQDSEGEMT